MANLTTTTNAAREAVARAKAILTANQPVAYEMEIKLGGGAYSDSASRTPKPSKGGYTQNHGGLISARTEAECLLRDAYLATEFGSADQEFVEREAAAIGFEL